MKRRMMLGWLCAVFALFGMGTATWAEGDISYEVTTDFFSKYVWRGQNISDDWVFQPGFSATYNGLTAGVWGNLDLTSDNDERGEFIEFDYYLDYSGQINDVIGYSLGSIYYYFPSADDTTEVYGGLNFDMVASPSLTVYYDVDEADGFYIALGVEHSLEGLDDLPFGIDLSANLGWGSSNYNDAYWSVDDCEANDLLLSAAFPFEVGPLAVTPSVHYMALLGGDISDVAGSDDSLVYAGVNLAYSF